MRDRIRDCLQGNPAVAFAYLFGSQAGGTARPDSDWDVAVYLDAQLAPAERFAAARRLAAVLGELGPVDVIVLNDAPPLLSHRALQGEQLLVRDKTAVVRFFVRTLAASGDEAYWRGLHASARRRRLQEGTFGRP